MSSKSRKGFSDNFTLKQPPKNKTNSHQKTLSIRVSLNFHIKNPTFQIKTQQEKRKEDSKIINRNISTIRKQKLTFKTVDSNNN